MTRSKNYVTPCLSYMGYELEGVDDINDKEVAILSACYWMLTNDASIRVTAENNNFSKSNLHYHIYRTLKYLSPDMYREVKGQLKRNIKKTKRR